ncbi:predicted protein [Botrytis cinerea T4]|uniref:Uncharacterized protein n=1 Tax=Botryotinia fuckeliana (strain T4) TaxID=999810 RepID=G2XV32_BOTF4|nr:predicted protein [Botrytis cinerea T4]
MAINSRAQFVCRMSLLDNAMKSLLHCLETSSPCGDHARMLVVYSIYEVLTLVFKTMSNSIQ